MREEVVLVTERLASLPADQLSARIEGVLPVVGALLAGLHERAIRRFLATLADDDA